MRRLILVSMIVLLFPVLNSVAIGEDTPVGHIAVVGADYNVYIQDFADDRLIPITRDANEERQYQWVTWSRSNQLAYFCCDLRVADSLTSEGFVYSPATQVSERVYEGLNESIIYASWSPEPCDNEEYCQSLALLLNQVVTGGLSLSVIDNLGDTRSIAQGSPLYYQWDYLGQQLLLHRDNQRLDIIDTQDNYSITEIERNTRRLPAFQSASWSPIRRSALYAEASTSRSFDLNILEENGEVTNLVTGLAGFVSFSWSPDGRYVAYRTANQDEVGRLIVVDALSGEIMQESFTDTVISFFWSPDSQQLAYITPRRSGFRAAWLDDNLLAKPPSQAQTQATFSWSIMNIETQQDYFLTSFTPTYEMQYMMTFFDQFVPSHSIWSPDSRHIVYSDEEIINDTATAFVKFIATEPYSIEQVLTEGVSGVWSFE